MTDGSARSSVLYGANDFWACGWYRCYVPGVELKRLGYRVVFDTNLRPSDADDFDVVVLQAPARPDRLELIRRANAAGKLTVVELDDDVWSLAPSNPGAPVWANPMVLDLVRHCVEEAGLVTTPTRALAEKLRRFNPRVKVLPNMLPRESWEYSAPKEQSDERVVLGWAGSTSHVEDLRIIEDIAPTLLDRYPHVAFVVVGGRPSEKMPEHDRMRRLRTTDIQHYPQLLEQFHVGLIPLVDSPFNRSKSDLKFVEYSRIGIPSVASKLEPYIHTIKHGENGFLVSSPKDWLKVLTRLIEDVELRRSIGVAAYEYALTRHIDGAIEKWERAYGLTRPAADGDR